jgi:hypothetical protein
MMLPRHMLGRLRRGDPKTTSRSPTLEELVRGTPDDPMVEALVARWSAEAKAAAAAEQAALPPQPAEATPPPAEARPADPPPPEPGMPTPEPKWWDEMLGWRGRGTPEPYPYDDVRYETIHEYDPLERALEEED